MASWQVPNRPIRPSLPNWGKCISLSVSKRLPEKAEAELRVDVLELTPPVISLALPAEGSRFCRVSNIPSLPIFSIRTRRTSAAGGSVPARSFLRR